MSSSIKLTNSSGKIVTITNPDTTSADVTVDLLNNAYTIATVDDFGTVPVGYTTVIVKDTDRGGVFNRIASTTANGGTIFDGTTGYSWERQYDGAVNVKWFGAVGDGVTDDTVALQAAIDYCRENNRALFISAGEYLVTPGIDVTASSTAMSNFIMFGEPNSAGRHYSYPSKIVFDDDGTTTSGLIGMEIDYTPTFQNLMFSTTAGDARNTGGDFIGILTVGGSLKVQNCIFESCSGSAIKVSDLGYASFTDCIFRYNGEGLTAYYINWTYGTTTAFNRVHGFQNNTALQVNGLYHSSFSDCIFEYNGYGIKDFRSGCVIKNCYFEHNGTYGVFADIAGSAVLISNKTHDAQDAIYVTGPTSSFGFDSIGATKIYGNNAQTRVLQFYNREGENSKAIKCSHGAYSGELVLETSSGVVEGIIPTMFSAQASGYATKMYNFLLKGTTAYGTPTGFTITYVSTGRWSIDWNDATLDTSHRWPFIQVQGLNSTGTSYTPVIAYIQPRDSGGVWSAYASMSLGFDVYIYTIDIATGIHTLADRACMVQVTI